MRPNVNRKLQFFKSLIYSCYRIFIAPGTSLLNKGLMGFAYLVWLCWLFVGIAIISDIFMEAIETITAQTTVKETYDP